MKILFICWLILSFSQLVSAQDAVAGVNDGAIERTMLVVVRGKGTGRYLKRAEVRVGTKTYFTDAEAKVSIALSAQENTKILVSKVGYEKQLIDAATITDGQTVEVFLDPAAPSDNEVIIRGEKRPEVSKKSLSGEESRRVAPNNDPAQVTKLLPGVQAAAFGSDIAVRGSGPEDSLYYIDRFQVTSVFHAISDLSVLPEQLIDDVEFYAGGFGAQFGDATAASLY